MGGRSLARVRNTADALVANSNPSTAPASARISTSINSCPATDALDAPSENRTEISCCRPVTRDNSSAAILAQAIKSSSETEPNRIHRDFFVPPTVASLSGAIADRISASGFGNRRPRSACTIPRSGRARADRQHPQGLLRSSNRGILERRDRRPDLRVGFRKPAPQIGLYDRQIGARLCQCGARLEPPDRHEPRLFPVLREGSIH